MDGLRIAYLSCNGQRQLDPSQLAALGQVDVALISFENGSGGSAVHGAERARDLMQQLVARIVVPLGHHYAEMEFTNHIVAEVAGGKVETVDRELALGGSDLKGAGQRVVHIAPTLAP